MLQKLAAPLGSLSSLRRGLLWRSCRHLMSTVSLSVFQVINPETFWPPLVYATWRTKESGTTTCQVERWSVKICKDAGIGSWCSAAMNWEEWRKLLYESKNLYELWRQWCWWWWWWWLWVLSITALTSTSFKKCCMCLVPFQFKRRHYIIFNQL